MKLYKLLQECEELLNPDSDIKKAWDLYQQTIKKETPDPFNSSGLFSFPFDETYRLRQTLLQIREELAKIEERQNKLIDVVIKNIDNIASNNY